MILFQRAVVSGDGERGRREENEREEEPSTLLSRSKPERRSEVALQGAPVEYEGRPAFLGVSALLLL